MQITRVNGAELCAYCVSDAGEMGRRLDYGEAVRRGRFRCRSRVTGMRCVNLRNGHAFALSRQRFRRF